jgi:hypothetical protein
MFPDQGREVVDDLLVLWRDHSERLALRVMALVVLSFVTPPTSDDDASQQSQTVVATLARLLPPAPGNQPHLASAYAIGSSYKMINQQERCDHWWKWLRTAPRLGEHPVRRH